MIINVTGGPDLSLIEVNEALTIIQEAAHEDANIIFGAVVDPTLEGKVKITVIATGFDHVPDRSLDAGGTAPMQTPVDMHSYTAQLRAANRPPAIVQPRADITRRRALTHRAPGAARTADGRRSAMRAATMAAGDSGVAGRVRPESRRSTCRRSCGATKDRPQTAPKRAGRSGLIQ